MLLTRAPTIVSLTVTPTTRSQCVCSAQCVHSGDRDAVGARVKSIYCGALSVVACCTSDDALGGLFLAKSRYHIACGHRKTACSPVWDLFVRLQKPLLNDGYAARRSICAFSVVEGMWAVRADRVVLRRFDECDSQRRLFNPTEPLLLRGGGSADHPAERQSGGAPQIPLKRPRCCGGDIC